MRSRKERGMLDCKHEEYDETMHHYCPGCGETDKLTIRAERAEARLQEVAKERDKLKSDVDCMIKKAADKQLDGYRELGERAANAENERDAYSDRLHEIRAQLAAMTKERDEYASALVRQTQEAAKVEAQLDDARAALKEAIELAELRDIPWPYTVDLWRKATGTENGK
jgi:chromosome segregation ATPase